MFHGMLCLSLFSSKTRMYSNTVTFSYSVFVISGIMKVSVSEKSLGFDYPGNHKNLIQ